MADETFPHLEKNVSDPERWVSVIAGSALAAYGLKMRSLGGLVIVAVGGALVWRGATGHCLFYEACGISSAARDAAGSEGLDELDLSS